MVYNFICTSKTCRYKPFETPFYPNFASTENQKQKIMKAMILAICMLLVQGMAMANTRISGVVVDEVDASPLIGATVVLEDGNARQVMGVTTDSNGRFELKDVPKGSYILQCSYVGYEPFTMALKQLDKRMDLGEIRLKPASEVLDEVVVEGEQVIQKIDRQLVMPTEAQKKASTNGVALLQHLQLPNLRINAIEIGRASCRERVFPHV